ncbi:DUF4869 domain-containing protein [Treponema ruminis]|uniref:DUF4869 domain-containing protein n=1 Tax=Treponema ruminis TaxID=744515 RepID=A0A7W8GA04_9SPIR|nr:DUF4869 domain-containing protein [Treponema ruminis]MBB5226545.1 hypothetical protein [Treponema ruminis]QSI02224.1 DUF4869 domain-containing protein [Treponema ruminis]
MLNIIFGEYENTIYNTSVFFKNVYEGEWLLEEQTKQMILDIDNSKVISEGAIESPVLGIIPPTSLSGGVKTLILIDHISDKIFNASNCGDNCASWLLKIAAKKDVTVNLRHVMDFGDGEFEIKILNKDKIVHSMTELLSEVGGCL